MTAKKRKKQKKRDVDVERSEEFCRRERRRGERSRGSWLETPFHNEALFSRRKDTSAVYAPRLFGTIDTKTRIPSFDLMPAPSSPSPASLTYYSYNSQPMDIADRRQLSNYRHLPLWPCRADCRVCRDPERRATSCSAGSRPRTSVPRSCSVDRTSVFEFASVPFVSRASIVNYRNRWKGGSRGCSPRGPKSQTWLRVIYRFS